MSSRRRGQNQWQHNVKTLAIFNRNRALPADNRVTPERDASDQGAGSPILRVHHRQGNVTLPPSFIQL